MEAEERAKILRKRRAEARARVEAAREASMNTPIPRPVESGHLPTAVEDSAAIDESDRPTNEAEAEDQ